MSSVIIPRSISLSDLLIRLNDHMDKGEFINKVSRNSNKDMIIEFSDYNSRNRKKIFLSWNDYNILEIIAASMGSIAVNIHRVMRLKISINTNHFLNTTYIKFPHIYSHSFGLMSNKQFVGSTFVSSNYKGVPQDIFNNYIEKVKLFEKHIDVFDILNKLHIEKQYAMKQTNMMFDRIMSVQELPKILEYFSSTKEPLHDDIKRCVDCMFMLKKDYSYKLHPFLEFQRSTMGYGSYNIGLIANRYVYTSNLTNKMDVYNDSALRLFVALLQSMGKFDDFLSKLQSNVIEHI